MIVIFNLNLNELKKQAYLLIKIKLNNFMIFLIYKLKTNIYIMILFIYLLCINKDKYNFQFLKNKPFNNVKTND